MVSIRSCIEQKLKLKINEDKSAVDRLENRKFLGFTFTRNKEPKIRIAPEKAQMQGARNDSSKQKRGYA